MTRIPELSYRLRKLFIIDPIPMGALPVYDFDPDRIIIVLRDGECVLEKNITNRLTVPSQSTPITDKQIMEMLTMAAEYAGNEIKDASSYSTVSWNILMVKNDLYNNVLLPAESFPYTIKVPDPEFFGLMYETTDNKFGMFIVTNNIIIEE